MSITERERRLLILLIPSVIISAFVYYWTEPATTAVPVVADTGLSIEQAQLRLAKARATAAQVPTLQELKKKTEADLAAWEKRLIIADTPAQAQAQLLQVFRRVARLQGPYVELRSSDIGTVQRLNAYSEISMTVAFDCQIEGLVNLLTDIASQPEFLSWRDLRISSPDSKQKRINVSFTLLGLAPAKLMPTPVGAKRG